MVSRLFPPGRKDGELHLNSRLHSEAVPASCLANVNVIGLRDRQGSVREDPREHGQDVRIPMPMGYGGYQMESYAPFENRFV